MVIENFSSDPFQNLISQMYKKLKLIPHEIFEPYRRYENLLNPAISSDEELRQTGRTTFLIAQAIGYSLRGQNICLVPCEESFNCAMDLSTKVVSMLKELKIPFREHGVTGDGIEIEAGLGSILVSRTRYQDRDPNKLRESPTGYRSLFDNR